MCHEKFGDESGLLRHLKERHGDGDGSEMLDQSGFASKSSQSKATLNSTFSCAECRKSEPPVQCSHGGFVCLEHNCSAIFSDKKMLAKHRKLVHPDAKPIIDYKQHFRTEFQCAICDVVIRGRVDYKAHLKHHDALSKVLFKKITGSAVPEDQESAIELSSQESFLAWHCDVEGCGRVLLSKKSWLAHQKIHEVQARVYTKVFFF
jgi:hypothetical protein